MLPSVREFSDDEFVEQPWNPARCNLHSRAQRHADSVVVFVHGWSGSGYKSWHIFPKLLFENTTHDVAVFDYASGLRSFLRRGSDVSIHVDRLVRCIADLCTVYKDVHLICHSMGGIVAKDAIARYLSSDLKPGRSHGIVPLASVSYFGTPLIGTPLANIFLAWWFRERKWLRNNSQSRQFADQFIIDQVQTNLHSPLADQQYFIPFKGWKATGDKVVPRTSSTSGMPTSQTVPILGGHLRISKPKNITDPQALGVVQFIEETHTERQRLREKDFLTRRELTIDSRRILARLWNADRDPECSRYYFDALTDCTDSASSFHNVVHDQRERIDLGSRPEILFVVYPTEASPKLDESQAEIAKERVRNPLLTVSISPVGASARQQADEFTAALAGHDWARELLHCLPASNTSELYAIFCDVLNAVKSQVNAFLGTSPGGHWDEPENDNFDWSARSRI